MFKINYQGTSSQFASHAHSDIVEFIGELGLIGFLLISSSLLFSCVKKNFFSFKNFLLSSALILILLFDFSLHIPIIQLLFILLFSVSSEHKHSNNAEYKVKD